MVAHPSDFLTKRELQVLKMVANGKKSKEIAKTLGLSIHTIYNHRKKMLKKTKCSNSMKLVVWAVRKGYL